MYAGPINDYDNCHIVNDASGSYYTMFWTVSATDVTFTVVGNTMGYVALGLNSANQPQVIFSDFCTSVYSVRWLLPMLSLDTFLLELL